MSNQSHLSEVIQQSMSPVHAALNIPGQVPSYVQAANSRGSMMSPSFNPYYNPNFNIMVPIVNHAKRQFSGMSIRDDARWHSPTAWSYDQGVDRTAADPLGRRMAAAEELTIRGASRPPSIFGTGLSAAAFMGSMMIPGGFIKNLAIGTGLGMGADFVGNQLDRAFFGNVQGYRQSAAMFRGRLTPGTLSAGS